MKSGLCMLEISEEEFVEHIVDDEFLLVYGNPVLVRSMDGKCDCVYMSIQYYRHMIEKKEQLEKRIAKYIKDNPEEK